MRAVVLRVRAQDVETTLDRVLPIAPAGVYERATGPLVELVVTGAVDSGDIAVAAGRAQVGIGQRTLPDDPEKRAALFLEPPVVAGRFVIRSPAAPPPTDRRLEDIVIDRGSAFGTGLHPTTNRCLELMLALEPGGSFVDLGCGTGVLAIAAGRLGWSPVLAVDYDERSVAAAARNADVNGVDVETRRVDLLAEPPPPARTLVANVALPVQQAVRAGLSDVPRHVILSGMTPRDADTVVVAYADVGLAERRRFVEADWAAVLLTGEETRLLEVAEPPAPARPHPAAAEPPEALPETLVGQLATELPGGGFALSSSRELPTGARVAVLLAPGLFRLDLRHLDDTLRISVRNLSGMPIFSLPDTGPPVTILTREDVTVERPVATNARMRLRIGRRDADVVLSALSGAERGVARVSAQAIVAPPRPY